MTTGQLVSESEFEPGHVKTALGIGELRARGQVAEIRLDFRPGDTLRRPTDDTTRHGHFIVLADTRDEVDVPSQMARAAVSLEYAA